jgi:hypothetical protein
MNYSKSLDRVKFGLPVVIALAMGPAVAIPVHAFADSSSTDQAAAPASFTWNVQLPDGTNEAGYSADIPDAITLAEDGVPAIYYPMIAQDVTDQGMAVGASTVAVPIPTPTPVAPLTTDDSGS